MLERFGLLARLLVRLIFSRVRLRPEAVEHLRQLARQGTIVYVMRYRSTLDYVLVNAVLLREGLPLARFAPGVSTVRFRPLGDPDRLFGGAEPLGNRPGRDLGARGEAQSGQDATDVALDRPLAEHQLLGDRAVGPAAGNPGRHFALDQLLDRFASQCAANRLSRGRTGPETKCLVPARPSAVSQADRTVRGRGLPRESGRAPRRQRSASGTSPGVRDGHCAGTGTGTGTGTGDARDAHFGKRGCSGCPFRDKRG